MKNRCGKGGIGVTFAEDFDEVPCRTGASRSDHWNVDRSDDGRSQFAIEAAASSVAID